jgi:tetratricopeptide (TPR) repeat protein
MTFKLSEFAPYKNAVFARGNGDFATARHEFQKCVDAGRRAGGAPMISMLLFRLGDVEALDGNQARAIEVYEEAMNTDPGSPFALLEYARSLATVLGQRDIALAKLRDAEAMLSSGAWIPSEEDLSEEQYRSLIAEARTEFSNAPPAP